MDYIGSKAKLNDWIFDILFSNYINFNKRKSLTFLDACAGTGCVSRYAAKENFNIIANDIMEYSRCITSGSLLMRSSLILETAKHINEMNNLRGIDGFFYNEYSKTGNRLYFTDENASKIDACRIYIEENVDNNIIKDYLIYCLIEAVSRVSNTAGVYGAFLKKFKKRALDSLIIKFEDFFTAKNSKIYSEDIKNLLNNEMGEDILYIDPPYNERQYGSNYHIYETIARYDNPKVKGVTGLRNWTKESKSLFCSKETCLNFTIDIFKNTTAAVILLSYSSEGIMSYSELISSAKSEFDITCDLYKKEYKRYKSNNDKNNKIDNLFEYLFVFIKN